MCVVKRHYLESGLTKTFTVINFGNLIQIPEMEQKIQNKFFVFLIIAFELEMQPLTILVRILAIGSNCVTKHP